MDLHLLSEESLWESCLTGDKTALKELYCRFYSSLCNYGLRLVSDKGLVEDCIQDVFIKLIQNYQSLSTTSNVKGYLLKSLRNKLYDALEKEKRADDISQYEDTLQTEDLYSMLSFEETEPDIRSKQLLVAFAKLSARQQEIIYLYYISELNHEAIAEVMGINYQSSKNLLFRSLSKLRELFFKNN